MCASWPRIFCMALASIWRMRSADTPYSAARSCSVAELPSDNQRRLMMVRLRYSLLVVLTMLWVAGTGSPGEFSRARTWVAVVQENRSSLFLLLGALMFIPAASISNLP